MVANGLISASPEVCLFCWRYAFSSDKGVRGGVEESKVLRLSMSFVLSAIVVQVHYLYSSFNFKEWDMRGVAECEIAWQNIQQTLQG
jgi:hypothetical protein